MPKIPVNTGLSASHPGEARFTRGSGQAIFVSQRAFRLPPASRLPSFPCSPSASSRPGNRSSTEHRRWGERRCAKRGGLNVRSDRPQRPAASPRLLGISDWATLKPASLGHFRRGGAGTRVNRAFAGRQAGNPRKYWAGGQGGRKRPFHAGWSGDDGAVSQARRALKRMRQGR